MPVKSFNYDLCKWCGLQYQPVNWLSFRIDGFCSEKCETEEREDREEREKMKKELDHVSPLIIATR